LGKHGEFLDDGTGAELTWSWRRIKLGWLLIGESPLDIGPKATFPFASDWQMKQPLDPLEFLGDTFSKALNGFRMNSSQLFLIQVAHFLGCQLESTTSEARESIRQRLRPLVHWRFSKTGSQHAVDAVLLLLQSIYYLVL
jgi:hypothetical protein